MMNCSFFNHVFNYILLIALLATNSNLVAQDTLLTKKEVVADLEYLKIELEENHPNLYVYSTKEEIDGWFTEQASKLSNTVDKREAFKIITSISTLLKDGHSYIYPSSKYLDDFYNTAPLFPLDVFLAKENKLTVIRNHSSEQNVPLGAILTKINGVEVQEIQSLIVQHTCRDGDNLGYPKHLYYQFFPAYYSCFFGFQKEFEIEYISRSGEQKTAIIKGLKREEIKANRKNEKRKGIDLQLMPSNKAAILSIKSFDKKILKGDYNQKFKKEIKKAFGTIAEGNIEFLAIDLRDNQGGALSNGIYLLQHFMDSAFQCVNSYYVLKNGNKTRLNTKWDDYFEPKRKNHFNGKVYLFLNGGSYSCSSIVANTFQESRRGKTLGQMSGGSAYVNSGGPNEVITLPNTKILFTIPKTQYNLRKDLNEMGSGVIPDIEVQDSPYRIINGKDSYIEKFVVLMKASNSPMK